MVTNPKSSYHCMSKKSWPNLYNVPCKMGQDFLDRKYGDTGLKTIYLLLGDPEVTANIYCKSRNLPNTYTEYYSTDWR